ncbi:MAG: hypothetical protein AAFV29_18025 [Myxococcota bacterium]
MKRLIDNPPSQDARRLLESAQPPRGPRPDELAHLAERLAATSAAVGGSSVALSAKTIKAILIVVAGAGIGGGAYSLIQSEQTPRQRAPQSQVVASPAAEHSKSALARVDQAQTDLPSPHLPQVRTSEADHVERDKRESSRPSSKPKASPTKGRRRNVAKPAKAKPKAPVFIEAPSRAPSEISLIDQARALLDAQPLEALDRLQHHLRAYENGVLADERDLLMAMAAFATHKVAIVESARARLFRRNPSSAYLRRIDDMHTSTED